MHDLDQHADLLRDSVERMRRTVAALDDAAMAAPSALPNWSRAHVATHVARAADSRLRLLCAAREGRVGRQYDSEEDRAREIDDGARRPPAEIRLDFDETLRRLLAAVAEHPADRWQARGHWLGVGERPVWRVVPSMRREVEYHHVDLDSGYGPPQWPPDFVDEQLADVAATMSRRPDAPAVTLDVPGRTLRVHDGGRITVLGQPWDVLAWLTGRGGGEGLTTRPPGPLPQVPPLA
jgi:maleylpyruvate isomerase